MPTKRRSARPGTRRSAASSRRAETAAGKTAKTKRAAANGGAQGGRAQTIVYVHGIGNKPPADILKCQWDQALLGFNPGERTRLAYWVNRMFYPTPVHASCSMPDTTQDGTQDEAGRPAIRALAEPALGAAPLLPSEAESPAARRALERIAEEALAPPDLSNVEASDFHTRVLPLPKPLREFVSRRITKAFLKDVHEFLFVKERREAMRESVISRLENGGGPFVIIGHSQGSMVAYEALCSLPADTSVEVELFVTIGSPLGLKEVQDQLKKITGQQKLAVPRVVKRWLNVADPLDPVCADKRLGNDYAPRGSVRVQDIVKFNEDSPRDPHSGTGYLSLTEVRTAVRAAIDHALFQRVAPFTIARDLVNEMERGARAERHSVLIELRSEWPEGGAPMAASEVRAKVVDWIEASIAKAEPPLSLDDIQLEALSSYVSAKLTRDEIERLTDELKLQSVYRVFKNARKRAFLDESINALQCATAHRGYDSRGSGILWAVLDTGIDPEHPHFHSGPRDNIESVFDCTKRGDVRQRTARDKNVGVDFNGHGTHVAGILAGGIPQLGISGMAPQASVRSYKVLDDDGAGNDAWIIKALDHIYETNRDAASLVVHGVNLSLGGPFDPESFGCGDTPICKQLRRLWRQGVVVVLAAGNEGYLELQQGDEILGVNADLSIGDPANLEEAIVVGSIHKSKPHLYGVSYFSSRGPTADGRCKPDLVAPGERIQSCRAQAPANEVTRDNLYVAMSGTSMAAPHVSGLIACFLSVRREFIGYPDRVKEILFDACTDLKRERNHQGAGMPNLVKMLLST